VKRPGRSSGYPTFKRRHRDHPRTATLPYAAITRWSLVLRSRGRVSSAILPGNSPCNVRRERRHSHPRALHTLTRWTRHLTSFNTKVLPSYTIVRASRSPSLYYCRVSLRYKWVFVCCRTRSTYMAAICHPLLAGPPGNAKHGTLISTGVSLCSSLQRGHRRPTTALSEDDKHGDRDFG
jgi:hypothetical protein